jgi:hypothetical protein
MKTWSLILVSQFFPALAMGNIESSHENWHFGHISEGLPIIVSDTVELD